MTSGSGNSEAASAPKAQATRKEPRLLTEEEKKEFKDIFEDESLAPRGEKCRKARRSVFSQYVSLRFVTFVLIPLLAARLYLPDPTLNKFGGYDINLSGLLYHVTCLEIAIVIAAMITYWAMSKKTNIYLVEFTTLTPKQELHTPTDMFLAKMKGFGTFTPESLDFLQKITQKSSLSEYTSFPAGIGMPFAEKPMDLSMESAREEVTYVFDTIIGDLLKATNVKPKEIDILVVNCSLFCPTPSLAAMIIRKFQMREDIIAYNLGGMGCSAGLISIDLAKDLLKVRKNSLALVISTESLAQNLYKGNDRSMLLQNTLFRLGGSAVLLSNKESDRHRSKYSLEHVVRVHKAADDTAYQCVYQTEDAHGYRGVRLAPELVKIAGQAITSNIKRLAPLVLPLSEKIKFGINYFQRSILKQKHVPTYTPDFRKAFDHFCIHAGGRAVLEAMTETLKLSDDDIKASRATLYRYGNTSSSSIWYELNFIEKTGRMKSGHKVWQIAFGSGFKCNSAVWEVL